MKIIELLKKQGGMELLKGWYRSHNLLYAFMIIPFFITSRTGLEIFRLAINNRTHNFLSKKFKNKEIVYPILQNAELHNTDSSNTNSFIWFMWLQGIDNAPELVQYNLKVLQQRFSENRVKVITEDNLFEYIDLPEFIKEKWDKNIISPTHFSDIIRIQLMVMHGGMWVDSTVFFSGNLPENILNQDFFVPQTLKPGKDGKSIPVSNWLIIAKKNNKLALRVRNLLFDYWEQYNTVVDYFIFHHFMLIAFEEMPEEYSKILPYDNSQPHALLIAMKTRDINQMNINDYVQLSPMHKLTNKLQSKLETTNQLNLIKYIKNQVKK